MVVELRLRLQQLIHERQIDPRQSWHAANGAPAPRRRRRRRQKLLLLLPSSSSEQQLDHDAVAAAAPAALLAVVAHSEAAPIAGVHFTANVRRRHTGKIDKIVAAYS